MGPQPYMVREKGKEEVHSFPEPQIHGDMILPIFFSILFFHIKKKSNFENTLFTLKFYDWCSSFWVWFRVGLAARIFWRAISWRGLTHL